MPEDIGYTYVSPTGDPNRKIRVSVDSPLAKSVEEQKLQPGTKTTFVPSIQESQANSSTISSGAFRQDVTDLGTTLSSLKETFGMNSETGQTQTSDALRILDERAAQLESRRKSEIAGLNASFDQETLKLGKAQDKEAGATGLQMGRIGGFLGGSGSGQGALINLEQDHRNEMQQLEAARRTAIAQAENAYNDQQFAIAREKINVARQIEQDMLTRNEKFFNMALNLQQEVRAQNEFAFNQQQAIEKAEAERKKAELDANKDFIAASRETAILDLINQGVTEPLQLVDFLNFDEQGKQIGDITLKEVTGVLESVQKINQAQQNPDGLQFDLKGGPSEGLYEITKDARGQVIDIKQLMAPRKSTGISVDKLTLAERMTRYPELPVDLVGRSELEVVQQLEEPNPPEWFLRMLEKQNRQSVVFITPEVIDEWESFRLKTLRRTGDTLSISEAKALGVPIGTTESEVEGITPSGSSFQIDAAAIQSALNSAN